MILPRKISFHGSIQKVVLCYMWKIWHMLDEATPSPENTDMSFIEQSGTPWGNLAPVEPEFSAQICPSRKSQLNSSPLVKEAGRENSSMGGTSSDSDSGSGSESSADTDSQLESLAVPEIPSEKPSSLPSPENSSVTQKGHVNSESTSSRESDTNLPLKGYQKKNEPALNESNNEQPVSKKKVLRSLKYFLYEPIYSLWYRNENSNVIKLLFK